MTSRRAGLSRPNARPLLRPRHAFPASRRSATAVRHAGLSRRFAQEISSSLFICMLGRDGWACPGQLLGTLAGARGHFTFAGTPEQVADLIEDWFMDGAADGFNIMPPLLPYMFDVFVVEVVPILQQRGLFRTAYEGSTLREHYGLDWPVSQFPQAVCSEP